MHVHQNIGNRENSNQTDTSKRLFNVAGGPLLLVELVS